MTRYGGTGDATRTLRMLWGEQARRPATRGPRASLTVDAIAVAAIALADEEPDVAVSMRAIGDRLGRTAMALYSYVGGRGELLDVMYDRVHAELSEPEPGPWRERVLDWSGQLVALYVRHPWVGEVSLARPVLGPHEQLALERLLAALKDGAVGAADSRAIASALFSLARGTGRTIVDARRAAESEESWWLERSRALAEVVPDFAERFPLSVGLGGGGGAGEEVGLDGHGRDASSGKRNAATPIMERAATAAFCRGISLLLAGVEAD
jgi:AcrR family transcriptional regulator